MENIINQYQKKKVKEFQNNVTEKPLVSVIVVTYQHANYIQQCLDGILMQKTDFSFEILLGEDASTDGTRDICIEYAKKYLDKIRLFLHSRENVFYSNGQPTGRFNMLYNLSKAKGRYVAFCEGDDYWIDPFKLQKQVDYLEANPDYGMVHTDFDQLIVNNNKVTQNIIKSLNTAVEWQEGEDFVKWYIGGYARIITCTVCFRRSVLTKNMDFVEFYNASFNKMGDIQLFCTIGGNSKVKYFDESTSVKRVLKESASYSENYLRELEHRIAVSNAFEYYGKKFKISEKYYTKINRNLARRMIKLGIIKNDFSLLKKGLVYKNVRKGYPLMTIYILMYYLYRCVIIRSILSVIKKLK